jgi:hypothetical protein
LVVLVLAGFVAFGFLAFATTRALGTLLRRPDLLVPLGCTTTLTAAIGALSSVGGAASAAMPFWQGKVLGIGFTQSAALLLSILVAVLHAGWTTALVLQAVEHARVDLTAPLLRPWRWLPRTLAVLVIGIGGLLLLMAVGLGVAAANIKLGLIVMAAASLLWNLFTAAAPKRRS